MNPPDTDNLRERIIACAAFNTKHISTYEKDMKNLIIDVDMLVEQMSALCSEEAEKNYKKGYSDGVVEYAKAHKDTLEKMREEKS